MKAVTIIAITMVFAAGMIVGNGAISLQPVVIITSPEDGAILHESNVTVTGYASDENGMEYWEWQWKWDGGNYSKYYSIESTEYYEFSISIEGLHPGWNEITVTFRSTDGIEGSDHVNITYSSDEQEPVVIINAPDDGDEFDVPDIYVNGSIADNIAISEAGYIHEWDDGNTSEEWSVGNVERHQFSIAITLHEGLNSITVFAVDSSGNEGKDMVHITLIQNENHPPVEPYMPFPSDGARLVDVENVNISWSCFDFDLDDEVSYKILFEANDSTPDEVLTEQHENFFTLKNLDGNTCYYWQVIAMDKNGGENRSKIWHFTTKDNTPPHAYFTTPKNGHIYIFGFDIGAIGRTIIIGSINVELYADDNIGINSAEYYLDNEIRQMDFVPPYTFEMIERGKHSLKAKVVDEEYNSMNTSEINFTQIPVIRCSPEAYLILWPKMEQRGTIGDLVGGTKDDDSTHFPKHFVSPVYGYNAETKKWKNVTVEACISWGICDPKPSFQWKNVPPRVTTSGYLAFVPRDKPGKYVLTAQLVRGTEIVSEDTITVWIVGSTISLYSKPSPNPKIEIFNYSDRILIRGNISFVHTIEPSSIFTDENRPLLNGSNTISPPDTNRENVYNTGKCLAGGANRKWDNSRQATQIATIDDHTPTILYNWLIGRGDSWKTFNEWPRQDIIGTVIGNDDIAVSDEINEPYSGNTKGKLYGSDRPSRTVPFINSWNRNDDEHILKMEFHFMEFTRLQIGNRWYRISKNYPWWINLGFLSYSEKRLHQDLNGDGDMKDLVFKNYRSEIKANSWW